MKRGMGRVFKRGEIWWIAYYFNGREVRESSKSASEAVAIKLLKQRLAQIETGQIVVDEKKLTFEKLVEGLVTDYELNDRRSLKSGALVNVSHLRKFFGFDKAVTITPDRARSYQLRRREQGASVATINREVATLRRMLSIAVEHGQLRSRPKFTMLDGETVREGFLDYGDCLRLLPELLDYLRPLIEFLYLSGWRKSAGRNLEWKQIDMRGRTATLKIADSKNKKPWTLPLTGRLWEVIQERYKARRLDCPYVFHLDGQKIGDFRKAWGTACRKAGLSGLYVHDLRRSCARNLARGGVSEQVAMRITGHKTPSMYRRYRILDENEIRQALEQTQAHLDATRQEKIAIIGAGN
jgi:integrase